MREVDFRYLRSALESLNASTDLVLAHGYVKLTLSRQCSPYASRRELAYEQIAPVAPAGVLVCTNYRNILLVGLSGETVEQAAEDVGRAGRPFEDSQLGWDGPLADWVCEPVPPTLKLLQGLLQFASDRGLINPEWLGAPLLYAAWLVPVVIEWDQDGRPVFSWPDSGEPESEPVDQGLPVEV